MENTKLAVKPGEIKADEEHLIKMWTPYNITVDETYKFISDSAVFTLVSNSLKRAALPILALINKIAFNLKIEGRENLEAVKEKGFITVCNHVNFLDCSMIANAVGSKDITFTTIKENFEIPVVRIIIKLLGGIPIPRTPKAMNKFSEAVSILLDEGHVVHFYPEGVLIPYYNGVRGFRRGAFSYAVKNEAPVVPLVISYHAPKSKLRKKPLARIQILPPIYPDSSLTDREQITKMKSLAAEGMTEAFRKAGGLTDNEAIMAKYKK